MVRPQGAGQAGTGCGSLRGNRSQLAAHDDTYVRAAPRRAQRLPNRKVRRAPRLTGLLAAPTSPLVVRDPRIVAPNLLYRWRRLLSEGGAAAVDSDEPVVGSSELRRDWTPKSASMRATVLFDRPVTAAAERTVQ